MSRNYTNTELFSATECPSDEMLLAYADSKLSMAEAHRVEKHCLDCEMCTDTLDGIQKRGTENIRTESKKIEQAIDKRIVEFTKVKGNNTRNNWYFAAAAIALIISASFIYRLYFSSLQETEMAMSNDKTIEEVITPKENPAPDTILSNKSVGDVQTISSNALSEASSSNALPVPAPQQSAEYAEPIAVQEEKNLEQTVVNSNDNSLTLTTSANFSTATGASYAAPLTNTATQIRAIPGSPLLERKEMAKDKKAKQAIKKEDSAKKQTAESAPVFDVASDSEIKVDAINSKSANLDDKEDALSTAEMLFQNKKYKMAAKQYREALYEQPENCKALIGNARSNFEIGNYTQAQQMIEKLATLNCGKTNDEALLVAAAIAVKQGKLDDAKKYLQKAMSSIFPNIVQQAESEFEKLK